MKRLCMIVLALVMTTGAFAQKMWLGGSASFTASGSARVALVPTFGYFVTEDISVEGQLGLSFGSSSSSYGLTAVGRYWLPLTEKLSYTPGLSLGFDLTKYDYVDGLRSQFDMVFQLGSLHYKVNEQWMLGANFCTFSLNDLFGGMATSFGLSTSSTISVNYFF